MTIDLRIGDELYFIVSSRLDKNRCIELLKTKIQEVRYGTPGSSPYYVVNINDQEILLECNNYVGGLPVCTPIFGNLKDLEFDLGLVDCLFYTCKFLALKEYESWLENKKELLENELSVVNEIITQFNLASTQSLLILDSDAYHTELLRQTIPTTCVKK